MDKAKPRRSNRDRLRSLTLGRQPQFRRKLIDYYPPIYEEILKEKTGEVIGLDLVGHEKDPIQFEVRQPTVRERNELVRRCRDKDGRFDELEFIIQSAILFVFDPETGENVYEKGDYDALLEQPAGDFVDQFGGEAISLLTLGERNEESENSRKTLSDTQSSN